MLLDSATLNNASLDGPGAIIDIDYYKYGEEFIDLTGGWVEGDSSGTGTVTKNTYDVELYQSDSGTSYRCIRSVNAINFSGIETVKVAWRLNANTDPEAFFGLYSVADTSYFSNYVARYELSSNGFFVSELDVSAIDGEYYLEIFVSNGAGLGSSTSTLNFVHAWGE